MTTQDYSQPINHSCMIAEGCREFPQLSNLQHESYSELVNLNATANAKDFFIGKAVMEVLQTVLAINKWCELLRSVDQNEVTIDVQALLNAIYTHQQVLLRKLFETLVHCICFRETNEEHYYKHYLLMIDLQQHLSRNKDRKDYYERISQFQLDLAEPLKQQILLIEAETPELAMSWYLKQKRSSRTDRRFSVTMFESASKLLQQACKTTTVQERITLGLTYDVIFGRTSKWVHFTPSRIFSMGRITVHHLIMNANHGCMFGEQVLLSCADLIGSTPGQMMTTIRKVTMAQTDFAEKNSSAILFKSFAIGDLVQRHGTLFEVVDKHTSKYDLLSYLVHSIAGEMSFRDWLPASDLSPFFTKSYRHPIMQDSRLDASLATSPAEQRQQLIKNFAIAAWNNEPPSQIQNALS